MDIARVLALYDAEVRAQPLAPPGFAIERAGGVTRIVGAFNFISWWDLPTDRAAAAVAVAGQADWARARGALLLWRLHDHDRPADLAALLASAGFTPGETTTLMLFELAVRLDAPKAVPGVEVRRASTPEALEDFMTASAQAFGEDEAWRRTAYAKRLNDPDLGLYVAYVEGRAAAAARIEMAGAWSFGLLQGGGVAPEYRGLGLYRALVAARADAARARGLCYLVSDARETSRPILERQGFVPAVRAALWTLQP